MKMPFGKYRGLRVSDIPDQYLIWLLSLSALREPLLSHVRSEAKRRRLRRDQSHVGANPHGCCSDPETAIQVIDAGARSLANRHHPDRGGEPEKMVLINTCADWLRAQIRELAP